MNYLHFEHFEAACEHAPRVRVFDGWFTLNGRRFFHRRLKAGRVRRIRAFLDHTGSPALQAVVLSKRGHFLCNADETDFTGLPVLKPESIQIFAEGF